MDTTSLGDRMKNYENAYRVYLPNRLPVIIRCDMRAGHTYTRDFHRPFDLYMHEAMVKTAKALCAEVSGCKMAYTQSDEISLLVTNNDTIETQPWFGNNLQKIVSLTAAKASITFQQEMRSMIDLACVGCVDEEEDNLLRTYIAHLDNVMFDSRAFILPEDEVVNYFLWRQRDMERNSIQMAARAHFSHKECDNKNCDKLQEMLFQKGINWNDYKVWEKRGVCIKKTEVEMPIVYGKDITNLTSKIVKRTRWVEDDNTPIFTENRAYIENLFLHN